MCIVPIIYSDESWTLFVYEKTVYVRAAPKHIYTIGPASAFQNCRITKQYAAARKSMLGTP